MTALSNESVDPTRSALIKVKRKAPRVLEAGAGEREKRSFGWGPRAQDGPHSTSPGTFAWSRWWNVSYDWNHHAPAREEPEKGAGENPSMPWSHDAR